MGYSLSAIPRPIPSSRGRQRSALLLASVALHAAILIPVALNTVFIPTFDEDNSFEVWLDMRPPEPRPEPLTPPQPKPLERPQERTEQQLQDIVPETPPEPPLERPVEPPVEQRLNPLQQAQVERTERALPQVQQQRAQDTQSMDDAAPGAISDLDTTALPNVTARITRPHIEAIDGPVSESVSEIQNRSLPSVVSGQSNAANQTSQNEAADQSRDQAGAPDAPIPRRTRIDEDAEAALAAAAAGGALDDAWTYRPESGGASGGGAPAGGSSGAGGVAGNTATQMGRIYYGRTTPLDCTQPQMLSDVQRLSCDSADARRIREAIERGRRVMGTGDAARDARNAAEGQQQLNDYERRRAPLRSGVGVSQGSIQGGSGQGEALDELSGTNREIRKLQDQIGASNSPRAPNTAPATPPRD
ncbi:hypothetical protein [Brevundimonas terrae]|uniref:hypothetical protein n=1 Tax=Brevundimonas terrae TaxID=363631 RepID=UPI0014227F59|nr:hypothetical protein [Brevundimonas terrae]NIJ28050.1 hypothetical protein [Brevundimonas terrae]